MSTLIYQSSSSSFSCFPLIALCLARRASANPPARLPPPTLFGVARPESVPLPVPRLIPLSLAGDAPGFLPAAGTGLLAGGAGGIGFDFAAIGGVAGLALPLTTTDGVGTGRGAAAGGGGGGGGAARACSTSST